MITITQHDIRKKLLKLFKKDIKCNKKELIRNRVNCNSNYSFYDGDIEVCENLLNIMLLMKKSDIACYSNDHCGDDIKCNKCCDKWPADEIINILDCYLL